MSVFWFAQEKRSSGDGFSKIRKQARKWVIRLDGERFSEHDRKRFANWMARSQQHRHILYETAATWMALDKVFILMEQFRQKDGSKNI